MPPKKHEVQIIVEVPEQPPTLENNAALVHKLLQAAITHPNDVAATVAGSLKMDDYLINLQHGIVVDLWVEMLIECAKLGFKANKAMALLELVEVLRVSIVETQSNHDAKIMLKNFFVRHAGLAVKEKEQQAANLGPDGLPLPDGSPQLQLLLGPDGRPITSANGAVMMGSAGYSLGPAAGSPLNATMLSGTVASTNGAASGVFPQQPIVTGPNAAILAAMGGQGGANGAAGGGPADSPTTTKGKAGSKKKGVEEPPPPPKPTFDAGMFFLTVEDMRQIAPFIAKGIIQHWQLYATVGAYSRTELFVPAASAVSDAVLEPVVCTFSVGIQTPMPSHSLALAMPLEEHTRQHADEAAKAAAERATLQAREEAMIASEKAQLEAVAARRRAEEEEERLGMLYLKKATAERAVDQLTTSIEGELSERQRRIILRIQKLEDALLLATSTSNM